MVTLHLLGLVFVFGTTVSLVYEGKNFTLAFFPSYVSMYGRSVTGDLYFRSREAGTCSIVDQDGQLHHVNVTDYNITMFNAGTKFYNLGTYVQKRGISVSCSVPVGLYALSTRSPDLGAAAALYLLPVTEGAEYIIPSVPNNAFVGVVAYEDNTSVTLDIKSNCPVLQGQSDTKNLNMRDVYQIGFDMSGKGVNCDLGGTRIASSKPVAVFSGATILVYPETHGDHVLNQVKPVSSWGRAYVVPMVTNMDQYTMRIVASKNNTRVTIITYETNVIVLQARQVYHQVFHADRNLYLSSSEPVLVTQIAGNDMKYDAFSSIVSSVTDYSTSYIIPDLQAPGRHFQRYVTLITETHCTSEIGVKTNWTTVDGGRYNYSVALFKAEDSLSTLSSNSNNCTFAVQVTGFAQYEAYAYFATPSTS